MSATQTQNDSTAVVDRRCDFLLVFDVQDGNPNGDPDSGNMPRIDPETNQGLVSDVCLKRKIRDYVLRKYEGKAPYQIYVQHAHSLYSQQEQAFQALGLDEKESDKDKIEEARRWMCKNFFDVRAFGAVMSVKSFNCGQVRGPAQITFARSVHPIFPSEHCITRVAFTKESKQTETAGSTEMGRKHTVPYGLYTARGFITPHYARNRENGGTGFTYEDLGLLFEAMGMMFELDRSSSHGAMAARKIYVFEHESPLGSAPAQKLFGLVEKAIQLKDENKVPRCFEDYNFPTKASLDSLLPEKVQLTERIEGE